MLVGLLLLSVGCVSDSEQQPEPREIDRRLIIACYELNVNDVIDLLRRGADVNSRFGDGGHEEQFYDGWWGGSTMSSSKWTPLLAVADTSVDPPPDKELGEVWRDPEKSEALRNAIPERLRLERLERMKVITQLLISHNCEIDAEDGFGSTALSYAVDHDKVAMTRILLAFGANPNVSHGIYIDGPGDITPLHGCTNREIAVLLLDHGADVHARDSNGKTPIDWLQRHHDRDYDIIVTQDGVSVVERNLADHATDLDLDNKQTNSKEAFKCNTDQSSRKDQIQSDEEWEDIGQGTIFWDPDKGFKTEWHGRLKESQIKR